MSPSDPTKLSAATTYGSTRNYATPNSQQAVIQGTVGAGGTLLPKPSMAFAIDQSARAIPVVLLNYSGSPNTATQWFVDVAAYVPLGFVTFNGGYGNVGVFAFIGYTPTAVNINFTVFNPDVVSHTIVTPVTVTAKVALYIPPFS